MSCGTDHNNNVQGASQATNGPSATGAVAGSTEPVVVTRAALNRRAAQLARWLPLASGTDRMTLNVGDAVGYLIGGEQSCSEAKQGVIEQFMCGGSITVLVCGGKHRLVAVERIAAAQWLKHAAGSLH